MIQQSNKKIVVSTIRIKLGIFQGDSLSPLWFYLTLNHLSAMLDKPNKGYLVLKNDVSRTLHVFPEDKR